MKRIPLLISLLFLITTQTFSQNTFPNTGNSGIGTVTPQASLDIVKSYDAGQTKALKMFYSGSWGYQSYAKDFRFLDIESSEEGKILQVNAYGMGLGYNPPGYASPDKLYINGNVGIGTTNPINTLQVQHATTNYTTTLTLKNTANHIAARTGITLENDNGDQTIVYKQASGNPDANDLIIYSYTGDTRVYTSGAERLRINNAGNIGIGTDRPREKLSVNGNIRAHEVKVETNNWPDYVFAKEYRLPTLQETENHIKEKGHLSGIPSSAEVKTNGIDLGDMNTKLLQKIEELTLHLIQKEKDIHTQNLRIKKLEVLFSKLTPQLISKLK